MQLRDDLGAEKGLRWIVSRQHLLHLLVGPGIEVLAALSYPGLLAVWLKIVAAQ